MKKMKAMDDFAIVVIAFAMVISFWATSPSRQERVSTETSNAKENYQKIDSSELENELSEIRKAQKEEKDKEKEEEFQWDGEVITISSGVANGPSGYETYYNLPMEGVVQIMRGLDYSEEEYPYWVREDGMKMLGDYIMVAANLNVHPYGTILPCSRGMAIVCDTGTFAESNPYQLDLAVTW